MDAVYTIYGVQEHAKLNFKLRPIMLDKIKNSDWTDLIHETQLTGLYQYGTHFLWRLHLPVDSFFTVILHNARLIWRQFLSRSLIVRCWTKGIKLQAQIW